MENNEIKETILIDELINELYFIELKTAVVCRMYAQNIRLQNYPNIASILDDLSKDKYDIHLTKISEYLEKIGSDIQLVDIDFKKLDLNDLSAKEAALLIYETIIDNEEQTREKILEIADFALDCYDHESYEFIQWFVKDSLKDINELKSVYDYINECESLMQVELLFKK